MKIKHLLLSALAFATVAASCKKEEDFSKQQANLQLSAEEVVFEVSEEATLTQTITVTANRNWEVSVPDNAKTWLAVSPELGEPSAQAQTIEVTVQKNTGNDRTAEVSFRVVGVKKVLKVTQKGAAGAAKPGDGTLEAPYKASEALAIAQGLPADQPDSDKYITGIVSAIKNIDTANYGNAEYSISDDGTEKNALSVYRGYSIEGQKFTKPDEIKVGDVLVIKGRLINFRGNTPQVNKGSSIVSINGKVPEVPKETATGVVVATNKNGFILKTDAEYKYVFDGAKPCPVKVGDKVTVTGNKDNYNGTPQITKYTHEVISSGNPVNHPSVTELKGAALDSYNNVFGYVKISGILNISGNYYNVNVKGSTKTGSLAYASADAALNTKTVDVTGYFVGLSGGNKEYFNIVVTEIQLSAVQEVVEEPGPGSVILTFPDENQATNAVSGYSTPWTAKIGAVEIAFEGFNNNKWNNWSYIRCGQKTPATPSFKTTTPVPVAANRFVMVLDKCDATLVNSAKLTVATDATFTTGVKTFDVTMAKGNVEVVLPEPAANLYYKMDLDLQKGSGNGFIQMSKVIFWVNK